MKTYIVEGGIGKCVCFTAIIPALYKLHGPIQVFTPFVDIFALNPSVKLALDQLSISVFDPRIVNSDKIYRDVYKGNYINGNKHIIESMCEDYGVQYDNSMKPELFTTRYKEKIEGEYCIVQFSGGQPACNDFSKSYQSLDPGRNLNNICAQEIIKTIKKEFPNIKVFDFGLPNEPNIPGTEKKLRPYCWYHEALKNAKFHVSIDSCLNHFSGATLKPGVVLWGSTKFEQLGYKHNINLKFDLPNYINTNKVMEGIKKLVKEMKAA